MSSQRVAVQSTWPALPLPCLVECLGSLCLKQDAQRCTGVAHTGGVAAGCFPPLSSLQMIPALQLQPDRDTDMGSEFFETRQAFLSLCQGNHYQVG